MTKQGRGSNPEQERFVSTVVDSFAEAAKCPGANAQYWGIYDGA